MCGIFGVAYAKKQQNKRKLFSDVKDLFHISESRGKEAAGIAYSSEDEIFSYKDAVPASKLIHQKPYRSLVAHLKGRDTFESSSIAAIGHSRLVTNGMQGIDENNQPVVKHGIVCVHNGIIVNGEKIWTDILKSQPELDVDTEGFVALLSHYILLGQQFDTAMTNTFAEIFGETSVALFFEDKNILCLGTNTGSLYYASDESTSRFYFASEKAMLQKMAKQTKSFMLENIKHLKANNGLILNLDDLSSFSFTFDRRENNADIPIALPKSLKKIFNKDTQVKQAFLSLKRCTKCILPETMPMIDFDQDGVCNFCRYYEIVNELGADKLEDILSKYRRSNGDPDCLVAFSGGRDSSYGLHVLKEDCKMMPLAFSYDWGMVTDLGRRNQARMCSKLGVEHIWVSADIKKKRSNIRKNVKAWLKKPDLGLIPLFTAGDKQFFYHANRLMKQTDIKLMVLCENKYEKTDFKRGFCNLSSVHSNKSVYKISSIEKLKMISYYFKNFAKNPSYLNSSMFDTFLAFASYYFISHDFLFPFNYLKWDEKEVNRVLLGEYEWELADDIPSTWRIGDGTAAFYNYIYFTVAGFTEFDTFRSNQIREGVMTREEAMKLVTIENKPRYNSIKEYLSLIQIDFDYAMQVINQMPKHYLNLKNFWGT